MKKKKTIIIISLIVVVVAIFLLTHIPKRIQCTMTVANGAGETAVLDVDFLYYSNLILPSYVKGTLSVDGVEYIDYSTRFDKSGLFSSGWWKSRSSLPYSFVLSNCNDKIKAFRNRVMVFDIKLNEDDIGAIHYIYMGDSNEVVDGKRKGISFWGPAQNAEEAKQIAESFGYAAP